MSYREHRVDAELARWVECAWERVGPDGPDGYERIVPDGCMDLIWSEQAGVLVVGPNTTAFLSPLEPGGTVVGVRLHPGAAPSLFGVEAPALLDGHDDRRRGVGRRRQAARGGRRRRGPARRPAALLPGRPRAGRVEPDPLVGAAVARLAAHRCATSPTSWPSASATCAGS